MSHKYNSFTWAISSRIRSTYHQAAGLTMIFH